MGNAFAAVFLQGSMRLRHRPTLRIGFGLVIEGRI